MLSAAADGDQRNLRRSGSLGFRLRPDETLALRWRRLPERVVAPADERMIVFADSADVGFPRADGGEPLACRIVLARVSPTGRGAVDPESAAVKGRNADGGQTSGGTVRVPSLEDDVRPQSPAGGVPFLADGTGEIVAGVECDVPAVGCLRPSFERECVRLLPPAQRRTVFPQPAGLDSSGGYGNEPLILRRGRLTVVVGPPADGRPVVAQSAGVPGPAADGDEDLVFGRKRLAMPNVATSPGAVPCRGAPADS